MTKSITVTSVRTLAVALMLAVFALCALTPAAYAHADGPHSGSSKSSVKPEKLQKDVDKFLGKSLEKRNERSIQEKIRQVEKRIAELKKHLAAYEALLVKLQGVSTSTGTTTVSQKGTVVATTTTDTTPTLSGTARGVSTVSLAIMPTGSSTKVYETAGIAVTDKKWSHTVTTALATGTYTVDLLTAAAVKLASGALTIQ